MSVYFNTTKASRNDLDQYRVIAGEQNAIVLNIFRSLDWPLSPSQVLSYFLFPQPPLTSIRRAITTLTKAGALVKTDIKRDGLYGRKEFVWALVTSQPLEQEAKEA